MGTDGSTPNNLSIGKEAQQRSLTNLAIIRLYSSSSNEPTSSTLSECLSPVANRPEQNQRKNVMKWRQNICSLRPKFLLMMMKKLMMMVIRHANVQIEYTGYCSQWLWWYAAPWSVRRSAVVRVRARQIETERPHSSWKAQSTGIKCRRSRSWGNAQWDGASHQFMMLYVISAVICGLPPRTRRPRRRTAKEKRHLT